MFDYIIEFISNFRGGLFSKYNSPSEFFAGIVLNISCTDYNSIKEGEDMFKQIEEEKMFKIEEKNKKKFIELVSKAILEKMHEIQFKQDLSLYIKTYRLGIKYRSIIENGDIDEVFVVCFKEGRYHELSFEAYKIYKMNPNLWEFRLIMSNNLQTEPNDIKVTMEQYIRYSVYLGEVRGVKPGWYPKKKN